MPETITYSKGPGGDLIETIIDTKVVTLTRAELQSQKARLTVEYARWESRFLAEKVVLLAKIALVNVALAECAKLGIIS